MPEDHYLMCANCRSMREGTQIFKCQRCRMIFCEECCEGRIFSICPECKTSKYAKKLGEVKRGVD